MTNPRDLTAHELRTAREWWMHLADSHKGNQSIWVLLALYARHVIETQTVRFDGDEKTAEV